MYSGKAVWAGPPCVLLGHLTVLVVIHRHKNYPIKSWSIIPLGCWSATVGASGLGMSVSWVLPKQLRSSLGQSLMWLHTPLPKGIMDQEQGRLLSKWLFSPWADYWQSSGGWGCKLPNEPIKLLLDSDSYCCTSPFPFPYELKTVFLILQVFSI